MRKWFSNKAFFGTLAFTVFIVSFLLFLTWQLASAPVPPSVGALKDDLEFLSSAGLGVIFMAMKELKNRQGRIMLINLQPQIQRVFDIIKAMDGMNIFKDREEMDAYLAEMQQQVLDGD